jgi:hypothetical protein
MTGTAKQKKLGSWEVGTGSERKRKRDRRIMSRYLAVKRAANTGVVWQLGLTDRKGGRASMPCRGM